MKLHNLNKLGDDTSSNDVGIPLDSRWHYMAIQRTFAGGATNPYVRIWVAPSAYNAGDILYADGCVGVNANYPTLPGNTQAVVGLPTYADNAAALSGGLTAGDFYRTSTGVVMVVY